jgi:hypothetical protein
MIAKMRHLRNPGRRTRRVLVAVRIAETERRIAALSAFAAYLAALPEELDGPAPVAA